MSILDLYCSVDAFWQRFEPLWERELLASGQRRRRRATRLHPAEILTILILFQQSGYRTFKGFYTQHVQMPLRQEFPRLVSYTRFVDLMPRFLVPLAIYLHTQRGACTGISFIDSTSLAVCHPARIQQHRVFRVDARRGKTSVGWFYGFKLHLVVNDRGELLAFCLTPGNTDDRTPVPRLVRRLFGRLFGDKGYISAPLAERLFLEPGTAPHHQTAQEHAQSSSSTSPTGSCCANARSSRPSFDQLKNVCQIEHSRHRSPYQLPRPSARWPRSPIATSPRSPRSASISIRLIAASLIPNWILLAN